jgi:YD repeat-containing protein
MNLSRRLGALLLAAFSIQALADTPTESEVRAWTRAYFDRYAARDDWPGFLEQFDESLAFLDPVANVELDSRRQFELFYFWPDPAFSKHPDYPRSLVLKELIVSGSRGIGLGYFTPFNYQGVTFGEKEPMRFAIWLDWNGAGKIVSQTDWIDYPADLIRAMYCRPAPASPGEVD